MQDQTYIVLPPTPNLPRRAVIRPGTVVYSAMSQGFHSTAFKAGNEAFHSGLPEDPLRHSEFLTFLDEVTTSTRDRKSLCASWCVGYRAPIRNVAALTFEGWQIVGLLADGMCQGAISIIPEKGAVRFKFSPREYVRAKIEGREICCEYKVNGRLLRVTRRPLLKAAWPSTTAV